jgi:hypothetical protein
MTPTTDKAFTTAARTIAGTFCDRFATMGMPPEDAANLATAALSEIIAQQLGPFAAIERLRDAADVLERQLLSLPELD